MKVLNAFSINMLGEVPVNTGTNVWFKRIDVDEARELFSGCGRGGSFVESHVGHETTAKLFTDILGVPVPFVRDTVTLDPRTRSLLGQYRGPRLEEGATALPEGATIEWWLVYVD
jgi:hypothetical protein